MARVTVVRDGHFKRRTSGDICSVIFGRVGDERTPSTTNVEHPVAFLEVELFTNHVELVVLELLEGLHAVDVGYNTGGVDHTRAEEPRVEVVASVVVVADLIFVLCLRVVDYFRDQVAKDVSEELFFSSPRIM